MAKASFTKHRFLALDGMRGICALIVLIHHTFLLCSFNPVPEGYLSVDVFFALSGFVIAFAYGDKLAAGLGVVGFLKSRVRRLAPVDLIGSVFGGIVYAAAGLGTGSFAAFALAAVKNWLLVPSLGTGDKFAFPLNSPTWSLFAEFWVNFAFGLIAPRLTIRILIMIVIFCWIPIVILTVAHGSINFGGSGKYVLAAVLRAVPSFACGVLIFKLWRSGWLARIPTMRPMIIFGIWIALSAVQLTSFNAAYDLLVVILLVPALVTLLVRSELTLPAWTLWLGRISYPLYATHFIVVCAVDKFVLWQPTAFSEIAAMLVSVLIADSIARWYEPAARRAIAAIASAPATRAAIAI